MFRLAGDSSGTLNKTFFPVYWAKVDLFLINPSFEFLGVAKGDRLLLLLGDLLSRLEGICF
jgi:hypothetical protein